mmetsp:Transcript_3398/g.8642  ORF Transcript_3398/g.8642 Transcript_3398/m.8642 type:complete len:594 (+) Transcript_3398:221-2002(+)
MLTRRYILLLIALPSILCANALDAGREAQDTVQDRLTQNEDTQAQAQARERPYSLANDDFFSENEGSTSSVSQVYSSSLAVYSATADRKVISTDARLSHIEPNGRRLRGKSKNGKIPKTSKSSKSKKKKRNGDKNKNRLNKLLLEELEEKCYEKEYGAVSCEFLAYRESPEDSICECVDGDGDGADRVSTIKTVEELENECYEDADGDVCVFFPDIKTPPNSYCKCVPSAFSPENLVQENNEDSVMVECKPQGKDITETSLDVIALILGVISAFAVANVVAWTVASQVPGAITLFMDLWTCNSNEVLLREIEQTEAFVGKFFDPWDFNIAVNKINYLKRHAETYSDNVSLIETSEILGMIRHAQTEASRSKALGARMVAQLIPLIMAWTTTQVRLVEREKCAGEISRARIRVQENIDLLDRIKKEFDEASFEKYVKCRSTCTRSSGCFCLTGCNDLRVDTVCDTPALGSVIFEGQGVWLSRNVCENCPSGHETAKNAEVKADVKKIWSNGVNAWWERDVKALYLKAKEFVEDDNMDKLMKSCGLQCGPRVLSPQDQSCKCEAEGFPYCNISKGRCEVEKQQADSKYDCKPFFD